ncbi:hypothetical protein ROSMUCSMR3_03939 [Roseovarius mucosus]|uniref:Uncharacterized protein n=1 Tax=Roseovarius mucosus TaxID=215743 RepID=A0A1V0RUQ2_9RHOB|nr:hypothetical protein ROSMUCSMR3_03939 [Roseovarius mucosus]
MLVAQHIRNSRTTDAEGGELMGWMAPAPTGVAMRHTADVHICF